MPFSPSSSAGRIRGLMRVGRKCCNRGLPGLGHAHERSQRRLGRVEGREFRRRIGRDPDLIGDTHWIFLGEERHQVRGLGAQVIASFLERKIAGQILFVKARYLLPQDIGCDGRHLVEDVDLPPNDFGIAYLLAHLRRNRQVPRGLCNSRLPRRAGRPLGRGNASCETDGSQDTNAIARSQEV